MSGRFMKLRAGRYMLTVPNGSGPAGVHRARDGDIQLDRHGGQVSFEVPQDQRVYFWWRGPREPAGLRILGPSTGSRGERGGGGRARIA